MNQNSGPLTSAFAAGRILRPEARFPLFEVPRSGHREMYLSGIASGPVETMEDLQTFFHALAREIAVRNGQLLQEKIYGRLDGHAQIMEARESAFRQAGLPVEGPMLFLEGCPCVGGLLAGVQITAATLTNDQVLIRPVPGGRLLEAPCHRALYFTAAPRNILLDVSAQAKDMLTQVFLALDDHGFAPEHLTRTWIYLARILNWYGEFNRVRTDLFQKRGLIDPEGIRHLPASTGIGGRAFGGAACAMDLLALAPRSGGWNVRPMRNRRQGEAWAYGSSFARGMVLDPGQHQVMLISGTASIDETGRTVYFHDPVAQVVQTLMSLATLLESEECALTDLVSATLFCKDEATWQAWQEVTRLLQLPDLPIIPMFAEVCRDELLVEVEGVAVKDLL